MSQIFARYPNLKFIVPAVLTAVLSLVAAYISSIRILNKAWVPFPLSLVLTEKCAGVFFLDLDILNGQCLKTTISKGLGYVIVLASAGLKLPIVKNVLNASSTLGMSTSSVSLESIACACGFAAALKKNHAFSLWGELLIIYVQNMVLLGLARRYSKGLDPSIITLGGVVVFTLAAVLSPIPADALLALSTVIAIASRLPQLYSNYKQKHTGVMSAVTQSLQVTGTLVRLGTVAVETGDRAQILSLLTAFTLNTLLLAQVIIYWEATKAEMSKSTRRKDE